MTETIMRVIMHGKEQNLIISLLIMHRHHNNNNKFQYKLQQISYLISEHVIRKKPNCILITASNVQHNLIISC